MPNLLQFILSRNNTRSVIFRPENVYKQTRQNQQVVDIDVGARLLHNFDRFISLHIEFVADFYDD